jgi:para-aminobenzoate synthetase component 1
MKLNIQKWNGADAVTCARALSDKPYTLFFDSNHSTHPLNQWSFIAFNPIETIETKNGVITHNGTNIGTHNFFNFLQSCLDNYDFKSDSDIPFTGGAAGYFGYDLGRQIEKLPDDTIDDLNTPDACIGIYTNVLAFNHSNNEAWFIGDTPPDIIDTPPLTIDPPTPFDWHSDKTKQQYLSDVQKTLDYIYAGEIYQANISRRFEADLPCNFDIFSHYEALRVINPAPFSSYMNFGDLKISSCSPEQFLSVQGKTVTTRPIKGTLPSSMDSDILKNSKKDMAENIMIVDLLRNDLSKVCTPHSVKTPKICDLETFEGLHHLVSTVTGTLQKDKTAIDLLRACFPGGSITGAPKIRAQEIIEELETTRRGPYCGAMGYIDFNGNMNTNIIIRTLIYKDNKVYLQTGGGIVADSEPEKEFQETLHKAQKIFESFNADEMKDTA